MKPLIHTYSTLTSFADIRSWASLIVIIGYGFSDTHINKMLAQGLRDDSNRRLLVIHKLNSSKEQDKKEEIGRLLELAEDEKNQVTVRLETAKDFFEKSDLSDFP